MLLGEKILIIAVVVIVLFGYRRLPDAARSLGRSMRILKAETKALREDSPSRGADVQEKAEAEYLRNHPDAERPGTPPAAQR